MTTLEQRLSALETRVTALEDGASVPNREEGSRRTSSKKLSAKEFLLAKNAKSETQKTLLLAYYLEHMEGLLSFNVDDINSAFQAAREAKPKNMNDAVNKNVGKGFIMEATEKKDMKKAWVLTATGEKYVKEELNK